MLAHDERGFLQPNAFRRHDLEGLGMLQDAVLMDAALMREGIPPDDRLVVLHREGGDAGDEARGARQHGRVDAGPERHGVAAGADGHDDLLQRRVAGALAKTVHRAFDLPGPRPDTRQRIGDGEAEVVWQWVENTALSEFGTRSTIMRISAANSSGVA